MVGCRHQAHSAAAWAPRQAYRPPAPAPGIPADPDRPYCQVYVVQPGDTLSSVAATFNLTDQELIDLNSGEGPLGLAWGQRQ